jgi:TolA-binding protein
VATRPSANQLLAAARRAQSHAQIDRAEQLYSQVINGYAATPAAGAAQIALGRLLFERQPFEAVTLFDGYLRRRPSGTLAEEALFYRALSLEKLGESQTASASLRELLKRFPKSLYAEPARARLAMSKSVE